MTKKQYQIRVPYVRDQEFRTRLTKMGVLLGDAYIDNIRPCNDLHGTEIDYVVSLSKYDLLYLRLSSDVGMFKRVQT
jgi:hypothetical protein